MEIIQIAAAGVGAVVLALMFRQSKPEIAMVISLACCVFVFFGIMAKITLVLEYVSSLAQNISLDPIYMTVILKMIGITYVAEFASAICRDAGYTSIAGQLQVFAKISILALSMPVLLAFLSTVEDFL